MSKTGKTSAMEDWEVEDDLRTLIRAREIEADKARLAKAQKLARKKADEMKRVSQK